METIHLHPTSISYLQIDFPTMTDNCLWQDNYIIWVFLKKNEEYITNNVSQCATLYSKMNSSNCHKHGGEYID